MKRHFLCILSALVLYPFTAHAAEDPKLKALKEVALSELQSKELSPDLPAKAVVVDPQENIWFLGRQFLWKWIPNKNTLQQIKLGGKRSLQSIAASGDLILVTDDEQIFQLESEPFKVLSFPSPNKESQSLALLADQKDLLYWIKSDGIYEFSTLNKTLKKIYAHTLSGTEDSKYLFVPQTKTLWLTKDRELSYISYGDNKKPKKLGKIEKNILDIQKSQEDIFALSPYAIFRYTKRAKLLQTVSVNPQRRIVLTSLQPNVHAYIFQDRLVEVHLPSEKKVFHFSLDIGRIRKAKTMSFRNSYLAIILDGNPRVFRFTNELGNAT